jgi:ATP-dependent exoDNAse (exonuclease V) alpha subunit
MADFRFSASKPLSRGKGQSVIAKAAYNAREKLTDERTGEVKDFSRLSGLRFSGIFPGSKDAGEWAQNREQLWNKAEQAEKRKDARLGQEIQLSLPHEMTDQQREWLVKDFVREQFMRKGITADVVIHEPPKGGDGRNHHAHILLTMREIGPDGFGKKLPDRDERQIERWREQWANLQNHHLERHGHEARVDHRSLEAQGIERAPTTHRGPHVDAIERRGVEADNTRENAERVAELAQLRAAFTNITHDIAAEHRAHFERMLTDDNYRREYEQQQRETARQQEEENARTANHNVNNPGDWTERGGMAQQQASALEYAKKVQEQANESDRAGMTAEPVNTNEMSDAAQAKEEKRDRDRQARDGREKSDKDQVFQHIQSVTGRDYRQR